MNTIKQEAERILEKHIHPSLKANAVTRESILSAMEEYAQSLQRPGWVKASERLPDEQKADRPIKVDGLYYMGWYSDDNNTWYTDSDICFNCDNLEWLDEGGSDGWISVETPPEVGEYVLVIVGEDTVLKGRLMNNGWTAFFSDGEKLVGEIRPVTMWQPLPSPPKQQP
jgi:hypothetical protein